MQKYVSFASFYSKFMLTSPFSYLSKKAEKRFTFFILLATIIIGCFMIYFDSFLKNGICKNGIISFQLVNNIEDSKTILDSWNLKSKISAGLSLGLDYLFMLLYPALIAVLIHKLNQKLWSNHSFYKVGVYTIFAQFFTAIFDAIENVGLIQLLLGNIDQFWTSLAYYFASIKFVLIITGIAYILLNFCYFLIQKFIKNE